MILKILNINWNYRKCDHCWRKGKNMWMHGGLKSVTGDYCQKHKYMFDNKCIKVYGVKI